MDIPFYNNYNRKNYKQTMSMNIMNTLIKTICILCLLSLNCSLLFPTKTPIDSVYYITGNEQSKNLLVMLPGRSEGIDSYAKHEFIKTLKESGIGFDATAVDAHLGYYYQENLIVRLHEDVISPAKRKGYENIWIFGISLGGMGALWYGKDKGEMINGIIAISPFVGDKVVIDEIKAAGGPAKWIPKEPIAKEDYQRGLWVWLKKYAKESESLPKLVLGYGLQDEFAYGDDIVAQMLPNNQVFTVPGSHEWKTWDSLFNMILKSGKINKK
jgi:pimeloyl-ACP methyl ester carboxylesterase